MDLGRGTRATVEELIASFLKYQHLQIAAMEREDVPAGNRRFDKMYAAPTQLAKTSAGRDALETSDGGNRFRTGDREGGGRPGMDSVPPG